MNHLAPSSAKALIFAVAAAVCGTSMAAATTQAGATPDAPPDFSAQKIPGAVRDAGVYHLATGTWTRTSGSLANFGPDTIYANTSPSGYFLSSAGGSGGSNPGSLAIDEGAIPTSLNTNYPGANRDSYNVNCISLNYCDLSVGGSTGWELTFYNDYAPCTFDPSPDTTLSLSGLPQNGCWNVTIDLTGGSEFCLAGDGGDLSGAAPTRSFGWGFRYIGVTTTPGLAGFVLAGDPAATDPTYLPGGLPSDGTNTYYGPPSACPGGATGLYTQDSFWVGDPAAPASGICAMGSYLGTTGCSVPSSPYASFFLELQADTSSCGTSPGPFEYCLSSPNSTGANATMTITGSASIAADDVTLTASLPPNAFGFYLTSPTQGFSTPMGGSGNVCLAGNIGRFVAAGQIKNSGAAGEISLSTALGEWSLASVPGAMGPYAATVGMRSNFQLWHRDISGGTATFNFTNGYSVTWIN